MAWSRRYDKGRQCLDWLSDRCCGIIQLGGEANAKLDEQCRQHPAQRMRQHGNGGLPRFQADAGGLPRGEKTADEIVAQYVAAFSKKQ